jgi:hypothetical protein
LKIEEEHFYGWLKVKLCASKLPTIGANGTLFEKSFLENEVEDYLFDIDIIANKSERQCLKFAKIKIGIVHLYCGSNIKKFFRKQKRRVRDYLYYQEKKVRKYPWKDQNKAGMLKFIFYTIMVIPLLLQSLVGFFKKPDFAWFFHPVACLITLWVYGIEVFFSKFKTTEMNRKNWKQ